MATFLLFIIFVVAAIAFARRAHELERRVDKLSAELNRLERQQLRAEPGKAPPELPKAAVPVVTPKPEAPASERDEETIPEFEPRAPEPIAPKAEAPRPEKSGPPQRDFGDILTDAIKRIGPKDPNMGWEMALGTYWLPRIGGAAFAVAIVFLLSLAWDRWGPPPPEVRVGIAYSACVLFLFGAWRLERKYPAYARVLFGIGIAGTYFVTYATHYVPFARIFESPIPSLALLAAVVTAWAVVAQRRRSRIIAALATVLGHLTIAIATFTVDDISAYTVVGIVFLSAGSAFFLLRNGWYYTAALGLAGSYANHFFVVVRSESAGTPQELAIGLAVLSVYFAVFALAELLAPDNLRRQSIPLGARTAYVTFNTGAYLALGLLVINAYDFSEGHRHLFPYALAATVLALGLAYLRIRKDDPLFNAYFTKAVGILSLGLAIQYDGNTLTVSLAVETVALLIAARRSGLVVTRILAFAIAALAFAHGVNIIESTPQLPYTGAAYWPNALGAAAVVLAFWIASYLYERTDWSTRSSGLLPLGDEINTWLYQLDIVQRPPETSHDAEKPFDGLLFPHVYSIAGALLFLGYTLLYIELGDRMLIIALASAIFTALAAMLNAFPFGLVSILFALFAFITGMIEINQGIEIPTAVVGLCALAATAVASESRYVGVRTGLQWHQNEVLPFALYAFPLTLLGWYLATELASPNSVFAIAAAAFLAALASLRLHRGALACASVALLVWAQLQWHAAWREEGISVHLSALLVAALSIFADRFYNPSTWKPAGRLALAALWALSMHYVFRTFESEWYGLFASLIGGAYLAYTLAFRTRTAALASAAAAAVGAYVAIMVAYNRGSDESITAIVASFAGPVILLIAYERLATALAEKLNLSIPSMPAAVFVTGATVLSVLMLERIPVLSEFFLTISWSILAVVLFGVSIAFHEKRYRYAGLAVLLLASLRVLIVDTRELEPFFRVCAWAGLGIVLLALGFGYVKAFAREQESPQEPE